MGLTEDQEREVGRIARLEVREYFDYYLNEVFPQQVTGIKAHAHATVRDHNGDRKAHGSAEAKVNRIVYGIGALVAVVGFAVTVKSLFF